MAMVSTDILLNCVMCKRVDTIQNCSYIKTVLEKLKPEGKEGAEI